MNRRPLTPDKNGDLKYRFRIQRVGIELEGAWSKLPFDFSLCGACNSPSCAACAEYRKYFHHDESVKNLREWGYVGEIISPPLIRKDLWEWIRAKYPQGVNRTCGVHVHMSLRHKCDYERLMDRRYHEHVLKGFIRWGHKNKIPEEDEFWKRLFGANAFCRDNFDPDAQAQYTNGMPQTARDHRFAAINFCWAVHQTLEYRVLPTFKDPNLTIRAVRRLLNLTEEFLWIVYDQLKEPDPAFTAEIGVVRTSGPAIEKKVAVDSAVSLLRSETYSRVQERKLTCA